VAGLLLSAVPAGDVDRQWRSPGAQLQQHHSTAQQQIASIVMLTADVGSSTQTGY